VGGTSTGNVFLEVAPTNSAVSTDWVVNGQATNSQQFTGLVVLSSVQISTQQLSTFVPAGFYAKLRSNTSGTATCTYVTGVEVIG
jgi:hypothetical protein